MGVKDPTTRFWGRRFKPLKYLDLFRKKVPDSAILSVVGVLIPFSRNSQPWMVTRLHLATLITPLFYVIFTILEVLSLKLNNQQKNILSCLPYFTF